MGAMGVVQGQSRKVQPVGQGKATSFGIIWNSITKAPRGALVGWKGVSGAAWPSSAANSPTLDELSRTT
jgi:hypothetical protein